MSNNDVIMCNTGVMMVLHYYIFLRIIDLVQNEGKNSSSGMPEDAFLGEVYIRNYK